MKRKSFFSVIAICIFSFTVSLAASFDSEKTSTPTEKTICSGGQLSELDKNGLIQAYRKELSNAPGASKGFWPWPFERGQSLSLIVKTRYKNRSFRVWPST
jgi:hypothetical protein